MGSAPSTTASSSVDNKEPLQVSLNKIYTQCMHEQPFGSGLICWVFLSLWVAKQLTTTLHQLIKYN